MNPFRYAFRITLAVLSFTAIRQAQAITFPSGTSIVATGVFADDSGLYQDQFTLTSAQNLTFATTSFATGNFLPVLTLFNATTGKPIDFSNSGLGDVSIIDVLASGSYVLDLTEYPNEAVGKLSDGFLFSSDPTATGDLCGASNTGKSFINATTCSSIPLGKSYTVTATASPASVAATPEPSSLMLVIAPAAALVGFVRRRRLNA